MVNANIVISVSAVLVAVILTIVFVLRQTNSDFPADNFSVSADGFTEDGGAASMYFCVGQDCQFYDMDYELNDFPGYFALVGFTKEGETFITEHSVGFTFQFDADGNLVKCYDSASLDGALVASRVSDLLAAKTAGDATYTVDGVTWNGDDVAWSTDLSIAPSVLGFTVPTPAECKAANSDPEVDKPAGDFGPDVGFDPNVSPPPGRRLTQDGEPVRALWNSGSAQLQTTAWSMAAASTAYDGVAVANQIIFASCVTNSPSALGGLLKGSAVARFIQDSTSSTMALSFAGSDDYYDWVLDLTRTRPECDSWYGPWTKPNHCACQGAQWWGPWYRKWYGFDNCRSVAPASPDGNLHWGFFAYQNMVADCVNSNVAKLWSWGIDIDMIIGHSLGAAAATVYKRLNAGRSGITTAQLSTWAGPKTIKGSSCTQPGTRYFDEKDPVASNGMGFLEGFNHDVQNARRGNGDNKSISVVPCGENAGGCGWLFDCAYYAATRHLMSNYKTYNW